MPKRPLTEPRELSAQMMMEESRMTVPARLMKDQPRSHMLRSTLLMLGAW